MSNKVKLIMPSYVEGFKCIAGDCEDSCCIGWDIDIDKITYRKYFRTKNVDMKKQFAKYIYRNEACDSEDVDYGKVRNKETKWCAFLNEKKLCNIYSNLGEDYLSNVCYSYPRIYNVLDNEWELSLFMSCPEAVRKLVLDKDPIKFIEKTVILPKHVIHSFIDSKDSHWENSEIKQVKKLRKISINQVQNRKMHLDDRLLSLGDTIINNSQRKGGAVNKNIKVNSSNYLFQLGFFKEAIESLDVFNSVESEEFIKLTRMVIKAFKLSEDVSAVEQSKLYEKALHKVVWPFMEEYGYMLEHYLVNFMFKANFPFTENESAMDGYVMLIIRYGFIRFYMAGIGAFKGEISKEDMVRLLQVYTKIVEHHKSFFISLLQEVKLKEFDNQEFLEKLLLVTGK